MCFSEAERIEKSEYFLWSLLIFLFNIFGC